MSEFVHVCVDPSRVFCDESYDPPPEKKPLAGSGKGNESTEEAVSAIIRLVQHFERLKIPTFWSYMELDSVWGGPIGVEKSGGGLHPRLVKAFPDYRATSIPKYRQSVFSCLGSAKRIARSGAQKIIFTGFTAPDCVKDSASDKSFYPCGGLSHMQRYVAEDAIADNEANDVTKPRAVKAMIANGVIVKSTADIIALT